MPGGGGSGAGGGGGAESCRPAVTSLRYACYNPWKLLYGVDKMQHQQIAPTSPDPGYPSVNVAVELLYGDEQNVIICGDPDADDVTVTSLVLETLRHIYFDAGDNIPIGLIKALREIEGLEIKVDCDVPHLDPGDRVDVLCSVGINELNGQKVLQVSLKDVQIKGR